MNYYISELDNKKNSKVLVLQQSWEDSFIDVVKVEGVDCIRLSFSAGWKENDLSFIEKLDNIYGVEIYSWKITDLKSLHSIPEIGYLAFQVELNRVFDLSLFRQLDTLKCNYSAKLRGFDKLEELKHLNLSNYPHETLSELEHMTILEELLLTSRTLKRLSCGAFNFLRCIDLSMCSNLESIEQLDHCTQLEELEISDCPKLNKFTELPKNLKSLIIENCGSIESLDFIEDHPSLERVLIIGNTSIASGDLSPLKTLRTLKDVRIAEGSYNMSNNQIQQLVS